jgi:hypothetical protein
MTGSNSFIDEVGTGKLYIRASDGIYMSTPSNALYLSTFDTGGLSLFHNGNAKLDTTATGIDVTGTVTADGLTVDGTAFINLTTRPAGVPATAGALWAAQTETGNYGIASRASATDAFTYIGNTGSSATLGTSYGTTGSYLPLDIQTSDTKRIRADANGDISFYNSAGSSQSFFWDASAESLGIGTTSPSEKVEVNGVVRITGTTTSNASSLTLSYTAATGASTIESRGVDTSTRGLIDFYQATSNGSLGQTAARIDSSGMLNAYYGISVDGGTIKLDGNYPVGTGNVALGNAALDSGSLTGQYNVAVGDSALTTNTSGQLNTVVGGDAMTFNTTGNSNTAIGYGTLFDNTSGSSNTAIGQASLTNNTTGLSNSAVGLNSLVTNTTGDFNVAVGQQSLNSNTTASSNTAVGYQAGYSNETGAYLTATGYFALKSSTADGNTAMGYNAAGATSTGAYNTAQGFSALASNSSGGYNTALGASALSSNTTASNNTAVGYQAGYSNTTGAQNLSAGVLSLYANTEGAENVAIGSGAVGVVVGALGSNTTGNYNTAIGNQALKSNTTASNNTAVGYQAGYNTTVGFNNTLFGDRAGYSNVGNRGNTFLGQESGYSYNRAGNGDTFNTFVGYRAGYSQSTDGLYNTYVGLFSGNLITTGSKNTIIGGYNGNQGGLDIRTASNYIVLSDGDGNPRGIFDSSGNFLVGKTANDNTTEGAVIRETGEASFVTTSNRAAIFNRLTTDGEIIGIRKDGTTVGSIGSIGGVVSYMVLDPRTGGVGLSGTTGSGGAILPTSNAGAVNDGVVSLGEPAYRFKDLYLSGGVYLGGTTSANHLDDYEEGTWTPTVGGTSTYTVQAGSYTKIGRMVYLNFDMRIILLGTGSSQYISPASLPFAFASAGSARAAGSVNWFNALAISRDAFYLEIDSNGIYLGSNNGASNTINEGAAFGDGAGIMASLWYTTTA